MSGDTLHRRQARLFALGLAAAAALGGCTRAHDCRPGTLFLNVHFAPHTGVQRVFVSVMVEGETTRSMTFDVRPPGADSGSIEVGFTTYPAGKHADLLVRLEGAGGELATQPVRVELTGGCVAFDVRFDGTDGGASGGRGGAAGTGATAGTGGGAAGTGGTTGTAGTGGGAGTGGIGNAGGAGSGGRGGGTAGAGGGTAGAGGGTAGAGGGTAGAGGRGGAGTGGGGTGGTAGTGLAGRGGGAGGGTTGTGGRGGCTSSGPESCFNYLDDDCDGNIDCADPDCNALGVCVALDPGATGQLGVVVADPVGSCPAQYTTATTINQAPLQTPSCSGCNCTPPQVSCVAPIYDYPTYDACVANASASLVASLSTSFSCQNPNWHADASGYVFGVGVGPIQPSYAGCTATGTVATGTPRWAATNRFCATTIRGGGCGTGSVCVPSIANTSQRCVMQAGSAVCPTGTQRTEYYTGTTGSFACNPCQCGQPSGAGCTGVTLFVGKNASCDQAAQFATVSSDQRICAAPGALVDPSIVFVGSPTGATCSPQYTTSGSLTPSGQQTVCCRP